MSTRLFRVILPVSDIEEAERAYEQLLDIPGERVSPGRHYFNLGGVILALYDPRADGDALGEGWKHHSNQYIYIAVEDLEAALGRARKAGFSELTPIATMPWGERLFYAVDPSGNPISVVDALTLFLGSKSTKSLGS